MRKRRWLRIAAWVLTPVILLAIAVGGFEFLKSWHFNPDPPEGNYPAPRDALEAQRQDLAHFRKLIAMDRSFTSDARAEAERRIATFEQGSEVLQGEGLRVALMRIVALADNGHTSVYSNDGGRANLVPIRVTPFADGIYVLRAKAEFADLLGARVVAIEGKPIADVVAALADLRGGTREWRDVLSSLLIMSPGIMHAAGLSASPDRTTWSFVTANGTTVERTLAAYKPAEDEPYSPSSQYMSARRLPGEPEGWHTFVTDDAKLALTLREFDRVFRRAWVDNGCVLLIEMKATQDENGESISDFLDATEADMKARPPCAVILDERFNGGGDYTNVWGFSKRLPELIAPEGRIYILTTAETFSAAITMTGFVKQAAPDRTVIVGQPVGDRMAFYSEGSGGCLPHAKLCVRYSTGKHDYANPCDDWDVCYWTNWFYPVRVTDFTPQERSAMRFADYASGRDPAFDRAMELAAARR